MRFFMVMVDVGSVKEAQRTCGWRIWRITLPKTNVCPGLDAREGFCGISKTTTRVSLPEGNIMMLGFYHRMTQQMSNEKRTPGCLGFLFLGIASYPVMWGLFHKP